MGEYVVLAAYLPYSLYGPAIVVAAPYRTSESQEMRRQLGLSLDSPRATEGYGRGRRRCSKGRLTTRHPSPGFLLSSTRRQYLVEYRTDLDRSRRADPKPDSNTEHFAPSEATTRRVLQSFSEGHRNFRFVIHIDGKMLRLTRWDRSGGICTSPFNYTTVQGRKTLRTILWKLSGLSLEQAGYDPTATRLLPSDPDFAKMTELADPSSDEALNDIPDRTGYEVESEGPHTFQYVRKAFERSIRDRARRYRLQVPLPDGRVRTFLVGRAAYAAIDTDCRGTRGYVAWDAQDEGFVWLKDAWRDDYDIVPAEGDRLSQLYRDGVQGIPTLVCYADLDHYTESTIVQSLTAMKPLPQGTARAALVEGGARTGIRRHCRMVVAEVCKPLSEVENGRVMTSILRDGVQGGYHNSSSASCPRYLMTPYVVRSPWRSRVVVDAPAPRHQSRKSARSSDSGARPRRHSSGGVEGPSRGLGALRANRGNRGQCRASPYPREGELLIPQRFSRYTHTTDLLRQGTWKFTSIRLWNSPDGEASQISDELQAFFHLVYYLSLRFIMSPVQDVEKVIHDYFNANERIYVNGTSRNYRITCSKTKRMMTIPGARLTPFVFPTNPGWPDGLVTAHAPLNDLLATLAGMVATHYRNITLLEATGSRMASAWRIQMACSDVIEGIEDNGPGSLLKTHSAMLYVLNKALERPDWPWSDRPPAAWGMEADELGEEGSDGSVCFSDAPAPVPSPSVPGGAQADGKKSAQGDKGPCKAPLAGCKKRRRGPEDENDDAASPVSAKRPRNAEAKASATPSAVAPRPPLISRYNLRDRGARKKV